MIIAVAASSVTLTANAAINLDIVYNSELDSTTAYYDGHTTSDWSDVYSPFHSTWGTSRADISPDDFIKTGNLGGGVEGGLVGKVSATWSDPLPWTLVGDPILSTSGTGSVFGFGTNHFYGPSGFRNTTSIVGSMTFAGSDLSDLGFVNNTSGTLIGSSPSSSGRIDMVTINWEVSIVPEPSIYAAIFGGIAMMFATMRRRRS